MPRFATHSASVRHALASQAPFTTYGAFRAVTGGGGETGRLPEPYRTVYRDAWWDDRITYTVYSYRTPIAWVLDDGTTIIPPVKYSITTSGHQSLLYALGPPSTSVFADALVAERDQLASKRGERLRGASGRPVPVNSGEAAIYSLEYLERTQGGTARPQAA
jgi:hypothetical protein